MGAVKGSNDAGWYQNHNFTRNNRDARPVNVNQKLSIMYSANVPAVKEYKLNHEDFDYVQSHCVSSQGRPAEPQRLLITC